MYRNCILLVGSNIYTLYKLSFSTKNSIIWHFSCEVHYSVVEKIAMAKFLSRIQFSIISLQGQTSNSVVTYLHVPLQLLRTFRRQEVLLTCLPGSLCVVLSFKEKACRHWSPPDIILFHCFLNFWIFVPGMEYK